MARYHLGRLIVALLIAFAVFIVSRFGKIKRVKDSQGHDKQVSSNGKIALLAACAILCGLTVVLAIFIGIATSDMGAAVAILIGGIAPVAIVMIPIGIYAKAMKIDENFYAEDENSFVVRLNKKKMYTVMYDDIISYEWVIAGYTINQVRITTETHKAVYVHLIKYHPVRLLQALRDMEEEDRFNKGRFAYKDRLNTLDRMIEEHSRLLQKQSS